MDSYASYEDDKLLFFEVNEGIYLSIVMTDGKIYYCDELVADNVLDIDKIQLRVCKQMLLMQS